MSIDLSVPDVISSHFVLHQLGEGIYAAISASDAAVSNSGIIDLGHETLIFDTFQTPEAARDLLAAAETVTGRKPAYVINSHWHEDHVGGNAVFAGIPIIATAKTRDVMAQQAANGSSAIEWVLPDSLFDERHVFAGEKRRAELLTYGGGHTVSDAFLLLPDDRLAFMGDLLFAQAHLWMPDGDANEWVRNLREVEKLDIAVAVPGHGPIGTLADSALVRQYISDLKDLAARARAEGKTTDDVEGMPVPGPYRAWAFPDYFAPNMRFVYETALAS
jgi:glyoxylase-like metal-dependent hydrolase (beta-lactamase superfamily II)